MADVVVGNLDSEVVCANDELPPQRAEPGARRRSDPLAREGRRRRPVRRTLRLGSTCSRRGRSGVVGHGQPPHACRQGSSASSRPGGGTRRLRRRRRRRGRCWNCRGSDDRRKRTRRRGAGWYWYSYRHATAAPASDLYVPERRRWRLLVADATSSAGSAASPVAATADPAPSAHAASASGFTASITAATVGLLVTSAATDPAPPALAAAPTTRALPPSAATAPTGSHGVSFRCEVEGEVEGASSN